MAALLHDLPVPEDQDHVGVHDGAQPVGNDKGGPPPHELVHGLLDQDLGAGVHIGGGLVQNEELPVCQEGPGDGEELLLAPGDGDVVLSDDRVVALGEGADEVVAVGLVAGSDDLLPGGVGTAVGHVLGDGALEEPGVLEDHGEEPAAVVPGHGGQALSVDEDAALIHVVEPHEEVDDGGLSRPGGSHDGHLLSRLHLDVQVPDQGLGLVVGEAHVPELHPAPDVLRRQGTGDGGLLLPVQEGVDPPCRRGGVLDVAHTVGDLLQRSGDLAGEEDDGHDGAHLHPLADHQPATQEVDEDVGQGVGEGNHRLDRAAQEVGPGLRLLLEAVDLLVALPAHLLHVVGLGGGVVGVVLLHHGVEAAALAVHLPEVAVAPAGHQGAEADGQGHENDDQQGQPPVLQQHHHGDGGDLEKAGHHGVHNLMNGIAHAGDVVGHPLEDLSHRGVVHKGHRQALEFVGNGDAQVTGEVAADHVVHQQHLQVGEQALDGVDPQQGQDPRHQGGRQAAGDLSPRPAVVEDLDQIPQEGGPRQGAEDDHHRQQAGQGQPPADGLCGADDPEHHTPGLGPAGATFLSHFTAHRRSPPPV